MSTATTDDKAMRANPALPGIAMRLTGINATTYYKGRLIADVAGVATKVTATTGLKIRGYCDNSEFTCDTSDVALTYVDVLAGQIALDVSGTNPPTAADHLQMMYAEDDHTVSRVGVGLSPVGRLLRLETVGGVTRAVCEVGALDATVVQNLLTTQAQINVPVASGILADGTPLAAFADNAASNPGITLANSKAVAARWNNNGTQVAVWYGVAMPQDIDDAAPLVLHLLASKSGATLADATTFTVAGFFQTVAALHDADADVGGTSSALVGNATAKTIAELTYSISAADLPASPANLSFSIKPTDGTLGTDDALVEAIWFEYTRKPLAA